MFLDYFFAGLTKIIFPSTITFQSFIFLLEQNIMCAFRDAYYVQMMKKIYLLPENLDQLINPNIDWVPVLLPLIDMYSS